MKFLKLSISLLLFLIFACDNQPTYGDQTAPGLTPKIFTPGLISKKDRYEFGICFSKDGNTLYFGIDINGKAEIRQSELKDGVWTNPQVFLEDSIFSFNDPMLSNDEKRLFFISNKSTYHSSQKKDYDIWFVEQTTNGWSAPINAGPAINSPMDEYFMSFTDTDKIYFGSNKLAPTGEEFDFDIFHATKNTTQFDTAVRIDSPPNTKQYEADVFIAPDESYIIFCGKYKRGFGRGDLYISFKDEQNNWLPSINMGKTINSEKHELCPFVTKDGKYFFYTSDEDIYWVSTDVFERINNY